jgi:lipoprotein NlpD
MQRIARNLFFLIMLPLWLAACSHGSNSYSYGYYSGKTHADEPKPSPSHIAPVVSIKPTSTADIHLVSKGETLYSIAFLYGYDVRDVAQWNALSSPYTIYPKQRLRLTPPLTPAQPSLVAVPYSELMNEGKKTPVTLTKKDKYDAPEKSVTPAPVVAGDAKISWQWPTNGKIIGTYSASDSGKKGVDIVGQVRQPIYAAADGRVVYSGNGLRGYGNLVIIKHNETYYSAYAHNDRLYVQDELAVKKGQRIADMGNSGTDKVMLHFEVRREGKPVDPLLYLPKRR